jgi:hypothetical protein
MFWRAVTTFLAQGWPKPQSEQTGMSAANRRFYLLAGISLLLVGLIAADGVRKGADTIVPSLYRHTASLAIAISELAHGTSGLVGLVEVQQALDRAGYDLDHKDEIVALNANPERADAALRAAAELKISDRTKTFPLVSNETGTIDYYYLAFRLFGYHVRSIYALYIAILGVMALCFISPFRHRAIFIVPSVLYLALLLDAQHALVPAELAGGTLTNARALPLLSLYPVLLCLVLIGCGRSFRVIDAVAAALAGIVFAFVVDARTYAYWQITPLLALALLIAAARLLPWRLPAKAQLVRMSIYPTVIFATAAAILIADHHWRRDASAYDAAPFSGHEFWVSYIGSTMPVMRWRIPQLEQQTGMKIENEDGYAGALIRMKIKERGEQLEDYMVLAPWRTWNEVKHSRLARDIAFDLWRDYPMAMIETCLLAFKPLVLGLAKDLGILALALIAAAIGPQSVLPWLLRAAALIAIGGIFGGAAVVATGVRHALPTARRLSVLFIPISILALSVAPTVLVMPLYGDNVSDRQYTVRLCLLIFLSAAELPRRAGIRLWPGGKKPASAWRGEAATAQSAMPATPGVPSQLDARG